ncbi:MAG: phosphatidylglycerol:prolipoprotein diacylglycerol transferase [Halocynthiibacter sp.]|jgi:phosphatidylglycerol:prolipoprotein diacylglycerol transferase
MLAVIPFPNISPEIFSIDLGFFVFALRWYALAYIVGILLAWRIALVGARRAGLWRGDAPIDGEGLDALLTWIIIGIIAGGRLGYVLFYQPAYYLSHPLEIPMIWTGGMSFHGGFAGVVIVSAIFAWRRKLPMLEVGDLIAISVAPGLMLGRVANFINAELWGRPTDAPWGVIFPGAEAQSCANIAGGLCARHPSQLYEAALEGLLLGALLLWLAFRRDWLKRPGQLIGVFVAGYGIARFIVEFYRLADQQYITPDNPFGHVFAGLTMGQLLSTPMILAGLAIVLWARRRTPAP